jgi:hypothetical protein
MDKTDYEAKLAIEVQKLQEYRLSLEQEHQQIKNEAHDGEPLIDGDVVVSNIDQKMLKAADDAAEVVVEILVHGDKDTTRLAAAKYILDNVKGKTTPEGDPWDKILSKIAKEPVAEAE